MTSVRSSAINASTSGMEGSSITCTMPSGAPALTAASASTLRGVGRALLGSRVRRHHNRVAGHQGKDDLEVHGGHGIGGRRDGQHHSSRAGYLDDLAGDVDARRHEILAAVVVEDAPRARPVLDHLVRGNTHLGLGDGGFGESLGRGVPRVGNRADYRGHCGLVVVGVRAGRPSGTLEQVAGLRNGRHGFCSSRRSARPGLRSVAALRAYRTATSSRSSTSSHRSRPSRMPGLNCSTRGSSVEKIAQTPFS